MSELSQRWHLGLLAISLLAGTALAVTTAVAGVHGQAEHRRFGWQGSHMHLLAVISIVGVWAAEPDTEPAIVLAGMTAPMSIWRWWKGVHPSRSDWWSYIAFISAAAILGATGRPAWVGGVACAGTLLLPLRGDRIPRPLAINATHVVGMVVASRLLVQWTLQLQLAGAAALLVVEWLALRMFSLDPPIR